MWTQGLHFEIIVIDNNSNDGTAEMVKEKFPQVKLLVNRQNLGFAKANNQGLEASKGKYLLFLNSDTLIQDDSIKKMVYFLKHRPEIGVAGPEQKDKQGRIRLTISRKSPLLFLDYLSKRFLNFSLLGRQKVFLVKVINGAALMIKKDLLKKIGGFSEKNFLYGDEDEICNKVRKLDLKIALLTDCEIIHYKGQRTKQILPFWRRFLK